MTRATLLSTTALLLALLATAPALAGTPKAYKCIVDGKTVYQDHPCAGPAAPPAATASVVAPVPASVPRVQRPPVQVFDEIQMVQRHERELAEAYKREGELARPRLATMDAQARRLETQQMEARWTPRIRAERQHLQRLQAELREQCPGGASMRAGRFECAR